MKDFGVEDIINLAKEKGFFYESSSIYGAKSGFYDYGSLGSLLKKKYENLWRLYFGKLFDNIYEIQPSEIMNKEVFIASKHLELFNDPIVECRKGHRLRADKLIEENLNIKAESLTIEEMNKIFEEGKILCPLCNEKLSNLKLFNLMFPIFVGPESDLFLYLEDIRRRFEILSILKRDNYNKVNERIISYIYKQYLENQKIYGIVIENKTYIFNQDKDIVILYDSITNEYFLSTNKEHKEIDEYYIEKLFNSIHYIDIKFDVDDLQLLLEKYNSILNNEMYLRPETAQGVYIDFPTEFVINRYRLPLGLYIIGKAFRNEISPRNALIRLREFTQAELQIFFDYYNNIFNQEFDKYKNEYINVLLVNSRSKNVQYEELSLEDIYNYTGIDKFYIYFLYKVFRFYIDILKIPKNKIRFYQLDNNEKSFYNMYHFDLELYLDDLKWVEVGGIHFRVLKFDTNILNKVPKDILEDLEKLFIGKDNIMVGYDLWNHFILSKDRRFIVTRPDGSKFIPVELELSFGVDRNIFSLLVLNYDNILKLPEYLSPVQVAIFPLLENKEDHNKVARNIYNSLRKYFDVYYDDSGRIGIRYKRQDEIGTPYCITVDDQTLRDNTVTIRYRDTKEQIRLNINDLVSFFQDKFNLYRVVDII